MEESLDGRDSSRSKAKDSTSSSKQQRPNTDELEAMRASNVAFNSMPPMRAESGYPRRSASPLLSSPEVSKQLLSKSCPDPRACEQSPGMNGELFQQIEGSSQRKIFSSHWSLDAVTEALEVCLRCYLYLSFFLPFKLYVLDLIAVFTFMHCIRKVKLLKRYFG